MRPTLFNSLMLMYSVLINLRFVKGIAIRDRYIGCYADNRNSRAMGELVVANTSMTLDLCYELCKQRHTTFFGTQWYEECFCADQYARYGPTATDSSCSTPCRGNQSQTCGGDWALGVYFVCPIGFFGTHCSDVCHCLNDTRPGTAGAGCYFNGTCPAGCQPGWTGTTCGTDIDECDLSHPRHNCSHNCINTIGSYACSCRPGYRLDRDGRNCNDIDECVLGTDGCQQNCTNTIGSYICSCGAGFTLDTDGRTCNSNGVNECITTTHGCQHTCVNRNGSYVCSCPDGFGLENDGKTCFAHINNTSSSTSTWSSGAVTAVVVLGVYGGLVTIALLVVLVKYARLHKSTSSSQSNVDNTPVKNTTKSIDAESSTEANPAETDMTSYMAIGDVIYEPNNYEQLKTK